MYLPEEIDQARVLITVKTYPIPNSTYGETVCTAGLLEGEKWVRIYPISWRVLSDDQKYPKYGWVELNLIRNKSDYRQESYKPRMGLDEEIKVSGKIGTRDSWAARKQYVLKDVHNSMTKLIGLAKSDTHQSLATLKPKEIVDFVIEDTEEKEWKQKWLDQLKQTNMFDLDPSGQIKQRRIVRKMPYKFKYRFLSEGDESPRELIIQDWEIGALFWNCFSRTHGDELETKRLVYQKYFEEFIKKKDIYFFLGTTYQFQKRRAPDPFIIVGVFYPPKTYQLPLL
jgi:hypothetical protein